MFGGYQACLADPIAALACSRVFPGYSCWTRGMELDLRKGGTGDLELRFDFPPELEREIREELDSKGRSTPTFTYGFYLQDGTMCTEVKNTVAIRPKGYIGATSPPAESEFKTGGLGRVEDAVRDKVRGGGKGNFGGTLYNINDNIRLYLTHTTQTFPPAPAHARLGQVLSGLGESEEMDLAQFKKVVESMGLGWSDRQVEDLFDALDRDGNGRIEVDEINGKGWFK